MVNHPSRDEWQQELRRELKRQKLPAAYIARLLAELDDHYEDIIEERSTSMGAARKLQTEQVNWDQRLGEPAQLAVFAGEQYHARSFWGRHPFITFVLGPLPMLVAGWTAAGLALGWTADGFIYALEHWLGLSGEMSRPQDYIFSQAVVMCVATWFVIVFPPVIAAAWLCRVARRNALNWRWPIVGCTLMAMTTGFIWVSYHPAIVPNDGRVTVGLNVEGSAQWVLLNYLPKFVAGLSISLLLLKRSQQKLLEPV